MLGEVVGKVFAAFAPVDDELSLADAVLDPEVAHVHCFGALVLDCIVGNAYGAAVVDLEWRWWLRMAKSNEDLSEDDCVFGIVEGTAEFGFSCGGDNDIELFGDCEDGAVFGW